MFMLTGILLKFYTSFDAWNKLSEGYKEVFKNREEIITHVIRRRSLLFLNSHSLEISANHSKSPKTELMIDASTRRFSRCHWNASAIFSVRSRRNRIRRAKSFPC